MHLPIDSVRASARQHVIASRVAPVLVFVLLLATAFSVGFRTTRGLNWPGADWGGVGIDLYRDISSAQTILNEGYGPDPTYRGERNWYNPLTPSVSAVVSRLSGAPVHVVVTRLGTYANLLAPLFACVRSSRRCSRSPLPPVATLPLAPTSGRALTVRC